MKKIKDLLPHEVNLLVAKLEGVEVEMYEGHVAERLEFEPEAQANAFSKDHEWMYRFYEPTKDWSIAGPIIERERIFISYSDLYPYADEPYAWSFYTDESGDERHERDGKTGCESAMRSFVAKHFGDTIELENLPKIQRTAVVRINGFRDEHMNDFFEADVEVVAETNAEAIREVQKQYEGSSYISMYFLRWK